MYTFSLLLLTLHVPLGIHVLQITPGTKRKNALTAATLNELVTVLSEDGVGGNSVSKQVSVLHRMSVRVATGRNQYFKRNMVNYTILLKIILFYS